MVQESDVIKQSLCLLDTPEAREIYRKALKKWHKRLKPLTDSIRRAQQITADDLNIRVGPCHDD